MRRATLIALLALLLPAAVAFAAAGDAPTATTGGSTAVTSSAATVAGTVNPNGAATRVLFQYGPTDAYGTSTDAKDVGSGTTDVAVEQGLTGLRAGSTYHYRVVARAASGDVVGADRTFTTDTAPAPTASTGRATTVSATAATLTGSVNPRGGATNVTFEYGETSAYGTTTAAQDAGNGTTALTFRAPLRAMQPNRTYHFRIRASSPGGDALGADRTFVTSKSATPAAMTGNAVDLSPGAATITGSVDPKGRPGDAFLEYGTSSRLGARTPGTTVSGGAQPVRLALIHLRARTKYYVRVAVTTDGGTGRGATKSFTTPAPPQVMSIAAGPDPVPYGRSVTVSGTLGGEGAAGARVALEGAPYPFSAPFAPLGPTATADAAGAFRLTQRAVRRTRVRVRAVLGGNEIVSAVTSVKVRPSVRTTVRRLADGRVRMSGRISPRGAYSVSLRRADLRVKPASVRSAGGQTRFRVTFRVRRRSRYALRVARRDRSLVTFTTAARTLAPRR
jgi:hypothetical protein